MPETLLDLQYCSGANGLSAQVFKLGEDALVLNISSRDHDSVHARKMTAAEWQNVEDQIHEGWCPHGLAHDFQSIFPLERYAIAGSVDASREDMELAKHELRQGKGQNKIDMSGFFGAETSFSATAHKEKIKTFIERVVEELANGGEYDHLKQDDIFRFEVEFDEDLKPEFIMGVNSGWMVEDILVSDFLNNQNAVTKAIEEFMDGVIEGEWEYREGEKIDSIC